MFVFEMTRNRLKKIVIIAAVSALVAAAVVTMAVFRAMDQPRSVTDSGISLSISNGCTDFLERIGLTAQDSGTAKDITIPAEFNETYEAYNALQQTAGFDLTPYKGQKAQQVTIPLKDEKTRYVVILTRKGRVIGGHLTNGEYGGDMTALPTAGQNDGTTG